MNFSEDIEGEEEGEGERRDRRMGVEREERSRKGRKEGVGREERGKEIEGERRERI